MDSTLKEKREAFLLDTIQHYNSWNRGIAKDPATVSSRCQYHLDCAIGRKIPDLALKKELDAAMGSPRTLEKEHPELWARVPQSLRELDADFLSDVQTLHDSDMLWCPTGLSDYGRAEVRHVCDEWGLDVPARCQE